MEGGECLARNVTAEPQVVSTWQSLVLSFWCSRAPYVLRFGLFLPKKKKSLTELRPFTTSWLYLGRKSESNGRRNTLPSSLSVNQKACLQQGKTESYLRTVDLTSTRPDHLLDTTRLSRSGRGIADLHVSTHHLLPKSSQLYQDRQNRATQM